MLKGRCAVITGSTQGLGYAMAERLAAEGCNIVMNGFGEKDEIESRRRKLESAHGVRAIHHGADVADAGQIADLVATARKTFGTVDVLINNAVVRYFSPIEEFKPEDWDRALAVNLSAAFHTVRLALPGMRERDFGRIVNVASVYGLFATVNRVDYVTTKTALIGFTRAIALETARTNITCNAICPGHRRRRPISRGGWRRRGRSPASRARRPSAPSSPRASRRGNSSRRIASRPLSPCCADLPAPTSPVRPFRSTEAGAPARDSFAPATISRVSGSDTMAAGLLFPATRRRTRS